MIISFVLFFFNDTATPEISTLSLHDALPISRRGDDQRRRAPAHGLRDRRAGLLHRERRDSDLRQHARRRRTRRRVRSEEHTSELQSQFHLVCRLLLEKKKKK